MGERAYPAPTVQCRARIPRNQTPNPGAQRTLSSLSRFSRDTVRLHCRQQNVTIDMDHHCVDWFVHLGDLLGGVSEIWHVIDKDQEELLWCLPRSATGPLNWSDTCCLSKCCTHLCSTLTLVLSVGAGRIWGLVIVTYLEDSLRGLRTADVSDKVNSQGQLCIHSVYMWLITLYSASASLRSAFAANIEAWKKDDPRVLQNPNAGISERLTRNGSPSWPETRSVPLHLFPTRSAPFVPFIICCCGHPVLKARPSLQSFSPSATLP